MSLFGALESDSLICLGARHRIQTVPWFQVDALKERTAKAKELLRRVFVVFAEGKDGQKGRKGRKGREEGQRKV